MDLEAINGIMENIGKALNGHSVDEGINAMIHMLVAVATYHEVDPALVVAHLATQFELSSEEVENETIN